MSQASEIQQLQRRLHLYLMLVVLLVATLVALRLLQWFRSDAAVEPVDTPVVAPRGELADFEETTVDLFRSASPSVVYINTRARVANRFSRQVFEVEAGTGSGFVWDEAGHIVTNFHVIQGASSAQVVFADQSAFDATMVGVAPEHDLAVLRVATGPELLRAVVIGQSDNLQVGQAVFAIGNPFGLDQTLTTGVVSARSRRIETPNGRSIEGAIQIDAAINPGNSGGPLLDSGGRLIGVNTAIFSPSGASAGVGFAIPVDTVRRVVPQIIASGKYEPPRLGISASNEISRAIAIRTGVGGIAIMDVTPGSVAADAGLKQATLDPGGSLVLGDILLSIDGHDVATLEEMADVLDEFDIGETVTLKIIRDGKPLELDVMLK